MEQEIARLAELFNAFYSGDETREEAERMIQEYEQSPFDFIHLLVNFIRVSDPQQRKRGILYLSRSVNRLYALDLIASIPEELIAELKVVLLEFAKSTEDVSFSNQTYSAIQTLVPHYKNEWEGLLETLIPLANSPNASHVIETLALYLESSDPEAVDQGLLGALAQIIANNYADEKIRAQQFYLFLAIARSSTDFLQEQTPRAQQLLISLEASLGKTCTRLNEYFSLLSGEIRQLYLPLYEAMLHAFETKNEGGKIGVIEAFTDALQYSEIQTFLIQSMELFLTEVLQVIQGEQGNGESYTLTALFDLFENAFTKSDIEEAYIEASSELYQSTDPFILSALARIYPPPDSIETIVGLLGAEDALIIENALNALDKLLKSSFEEATNDDVTVMGEIFEALCQWVNPEGQFNQLSTKVLGTLCEEALKSENYQFLFDEAENIQALLSQELTPETMLIAATLVNADTANETVAISQTITSEFLERLANEDDDTYKNAIELFAYESNFLKRLTDEEKAEFIAQLAGAIEGYSGTPRSVEIITQKGLGYCIRAAGRQNVAEHLSTFLEPLLDRLHQPISYGYDSTMDGSQDKKEFSHFHVMGTNQRLIFHNEEVDEVVKGLFNLQIIIDIFSGDIKNFEGFLESSMQIIDLFISSPFDTALRENSFGLMCSIIIAIPETAETFLPKIQKFFLPTEGEANTVEPENIVQEAAMKSLSKIICHDGETVGSQYQIAIQQFLNIIAQMMPPFIQFKYQSLAEETANGVDPQEYQEYFDCLWETMVLLKDIEQHELSPTKEASIAAYTGIMAFLETLTLPYDIVETMKVGLTADFLEQVPQFPAFGDAFQVLQNAIQQNENADARATALYGYGRALLKQNLNGEQLDEMLNMLYAVLAEDEMKEEAFQNGRENGASSFTLLLRKRISLGGGIEHLQQFIELLPVYLDADESTIVYTFLVDCLNMALTQDVKDVLFQALLSCLNMEESKRMVSNIVKTLLNKIPQNYRQQLTE